MSQTLLCIGHIKNDIAPLIPIAQEARTKLRQKPVFLVTAPEPYRNEARAFVQSSGFEVVSHPYESREGENSPNVYLRYRLLRRANLRLAHQILEDVQPAVILANTDACDRYFLDSATRAGYPTVYLQVAAWSDVRHSRAFKRIGTRAQLQPLPRRARLKHYLKEYIAGIAGYPGSTAWMPNVTQIAVQGPFNRDLLIKGGVPPERIALTGNPPQDEAYRIRFGEQSYRNAIYDQLGLPDGSPFFLNCRELEKRLYYLAREERGETQRKIIRALRAVSQDIPVVIRLHPREGEAEAAEIKAIDHNVIVVRDIPLMELLATSTAVISTQSTTLIWAAALDKPTISAFFWTDPFMKAMVARWNGVEMVTTEHALSNALNRYLSNAEHVETWRMRRARFVREHLMFDGRCTERLVQVINQLALDRSQPADFSRAGK